MFAHWDVERSVLAGMLVLILVGLGFIWYQRGRADELSAGLSGAERQLAQVGVLTTEVSALQDEMANDTYASGKLDSHTYIERQLVEVRIGKNAFAVGSPQSDRHEDDGYEDVSYPLTQAQGRKSFTREELGMFLLYLEGNTMRMKCTHIRLDRAGDAPLEEDAWKAGLTITDRRSL